MFYAQFTIHIIRNSNSILASNLLLYFLFPLNEQKEWKEQKKNRNFHNVKEWAIFNEWINLTYCEQERKQATNKMNKNIFGWLYPFSFLLHCDICLGKGKYENYFILSFVICKYMELGEIVKSYNSYVSYIMLKMDTSFFFIFLFFSWTRKKNFNLTTLFGKLIFENLEGINELWNWCALAHFKVNRIDQLNYLLFTVWVFRYRWHCILYSYWAISLLSIKFNSQFFFCYFTVITFIVVSFAYKFISRN